VKMTLLLSYYAAGSATICRQRTWGTVYDRPVLLLK